MTSTAGISDAVARVQQIQQQLQQLQNGSLLSSVLGSGVSSTNTTGGSAPTSFSSALAQAQAAPGASAGALTPAIQTVPGTGALSSAIQSAQPYGVPGTYVGGFNLTGGTALPPGAIAQLTPAQQQFASTLSADTGLNPGVVSSWLLAEESGGAAQARQAAGNNDWLNIGYTDSGTYGASDAIWSDPVTAAHATAAWLKGQNSIPGYGTASGGIQAILQTVGQSPAAQISALQNSGWASSGYPDLTALYSQLAGA